MKKLFLAASVLLVSLAGCGNNGNNNTATPNDAGNADQPAVRREVSGNIAYIQMDSLMANYKMFIDLSSEFEAKAKQAEADLTSRGRTLEKNFADAQNKVEKGLVTRAEAAQLQEDLQKQEQSFMRVRETKNQELAEENQVMTNKIFYSIEEYIKEFNHDYRYSMILTTSGGAPILNADPALDITSVVLKGLNEKYEKEKAKK